MKYTVVVMSKRMLEPQDMRIYSKQSSDKEAMIAYGKDVQRRYPNKRVAVMAVEKAKEVQANFYQWRKDQEREKMERCERNLNKLMGRMVYNESIKRVAER